MYLYSTFTVHRSLVKQETVPRFFCRVQLKISSFLQFLAWSKYQPTDHHQGNQLIIWSWRWSLVPNHTEVSPNDVKVSCSNVNVLTWYWYIFISCCGNNKQIKLRFLNWHIRFEENEEIDCEEPTEIKWEPRWCSSLCCNPAPQLKATFLELLFS